MQVRTDIMVLGPDKPEDEHPIVISNNKIINKSEDRTIGWTMYETIGISIVNPRGLTVGRKITNIGS